MQLRSRLNRIKGYKNLDIIKIELYSIFAIIVLDREYFKPNLQLKLFLQQYSYELNYHFNLDYIFGSRYDVVAKVVRGIEKLDAEKFESLIMKLNEFCDVVDPINEQEAEGRSSKDLNEILKKLGR